ncbi:hypothetical protein [Vallicoccus soli]|uniref:Uncharacterized protein n=1 Tax=Vallicoccus soli TaxID=2339232 RepID=A0A3A3Z2I5_9ACTN|nr:hypothetical protein [Vallicoccus soli]RJK97592.1 hypothetical protein D5H78_00715 [Vallicoccus soli]
MRHVGRRVPRGEDPDLVAGPAGAVADLGVRSAGDVLPAARSATCCRSRRALRQRDPVAR